MPFIVVFLERIIGEECMRGQSHIAGSVSRHKVNIPKRKSEGILLDSGAERLSFFALSLLQGEYLMHWSDDVPKDVVFVNDVGVSNCSVHEYELIMILVVPNNPVDPISGERKMVVGLRCGEKQIYLSC